MNLTPDQMDDLLRSLPTVAELTAKCRKVEADLATTAKECATLRADLNEARPKAAMWDSLKRVLGDMPNADVFTHVEEWRKAMNAIADVLGFSRIERAYRVSDEAVQRLRVAIAKQRQVDGWAQVARLLCGDKCDLDNVDGVVAMARSARDELDALRACVLQVTNALRLPPDSPRETVVYVVNEVTGRAPPLFLGRLGAWARLEQVLGLKDPAAIADQVESLVAHREGKERAHADELVKAQRQAAEWEIQAQDLRDKVADFHNQVSRALGVEPLSLTANEMLRRINEGAGAWQAHKQLVEVMRIAHDPAFVAPSAIVECAKDAVASDDLVTRLKFLAFPAATKLGVSADELLGRLEKALAAEGLLCELHEALKQNCPGFVADAEKRGLKPTDALLSGLRDKSTKVVYRVRVHQVEHSCVDLELGEGLHWTERKPSSLHERITEALHVGRSAESVTPDELVEWAKQTYEHRALVERLDAALRKCTRFFTMNQSPTQALCEYVSDGRFEKALQRSVSWVRLVEAYNEALDEGGVLLSARSSDTDEHLKLAIKGGVRLLAWMREQEATNHRDVKG